MNWSVVVSGFMYWNLILDRRPAPPAVMSPGARVFSPIITTVPQMVVGAVITFTEFDLYPVFDLCGRAIPGMTAVQDQAACTQAVAKTVGACHGMRPKINGTGELDCGGAAKFPCVFPSSALWPITASPFPARRAGRIPR